MLAVSLVLGLASGPLAAEEGACDECPGTVWYVRASSKATLPDGRSWASAFRRLQSALNAAGNGDCIWVASGRYATSYTGQRLDRFKIDRSVRIYGGFAGDEVCLAARAGLFQSTFLTGEIGGPEPTDNAYVIVDVSGPVAFGQPSPRVVLDGFHIRGAYSTGGFGGGVHLMDHTLELRNCVIADNVAGYGAGVFARSVRFDMVGCTLRNNRARFDGGGLWMAAVFSDVNPYGGTLLTNVVLRGNKAKGKGGGFYLADASSFGVPPVEIVNGLICRNSAKRGGGGYLEESQSANAFPRPALAELTNCTVADNNAVSGSAFEIEDSLQALSLHAQLDLTNCIVWNNQPATAPAPAIVATTGFGLLAGHTLLDRSSPHACTPVLPCTSTPVCTTFTCDPLFLPTLPYHPDPLASPAPESGLSALPPDTFDLDGDGNRMEPIPVDLDGQPREVGVVDRGAFEVR